jgi:IclR family pca regulon transcriptional regulator
MTSLARGLAVLRAFDQRRRTLSIAEVSRATGIPRAAVRRCLYTLGQLGYVEVTGTSFRLRPKILTLGHSQIAATPLAVAAQPLLDRCRDELHESCSFGVLDGDDIFYIARSETTRIMSVALRVGSHLPAYCTSMGRVLLSHLSEPMLRAYLGRVELLPLTDRTLTSPEQLHAVLIAVRKAGYALVDQELEIGLRSLAVPVYDQGGTAVAAINVGTQPARVTMRQLTQSFLPRLREAAAELSMVAH